MPAGRMPPAARLLAPALLLAVGGCGLPDSESPSLLPRPAEQPRAIPLVEAAPARLSAEEAARLEADMAQELKALAAARQSLAAAEQALAAALARAGKAPWGSLAWADAQVALSRFQEARFPVAALRLNLDASRAMVDPLAADDPARVSVETLLAEAVALDEASRATAEAAARALER
jgi:fused signal recognition particle receptor